MIKILRARINGQIFAPMMRRRVVPTRYPRAYLLKYFDRDTCYLNLPVRHKKKHMPHFSNVLCKFYAKDNCTRGEDCIFSHDAAQFPPAERTGPAAQCDGADGRGKPPAHSPSETLEERRLFRSPFS